jgi:DNA-binding transcriptional LysR family regulator
VCQEPGARSVCAPRRSETTFDTITSSSLITFLSLEQFPEVDLQFTEDTTTELIERLKSGDLDVAVAGLPVRNPDIICSELFRERLFLAVALGHPLSRQQDVHLHHIQNERFFLLKEGHCLRDDVLAACNRAKAEIRSVFETNQLESIFQLVRANFGLTLVPAMAKHYATGCRLVPPQFRSVPAHRLPESSSPLCQQIHASIHRLAAVL